MASFFLFWYFEYCYSVDPDFPINNTQKFFEIKLSKDFPGKDTRKIRQNQALLHQSKTNQKIIKKNIFSKVKQNILWYKNIFQAKRICFKGKNIFIKAIQTKLLLKVSNRMVKKIKFSFFSQTNAKKQMIQILK